MPIIRLTIILVLIACLVLSAAYLVTRKPSYLHYLKQILQFFAWFLLACGLLFLISRLIRF
jgi:hypothetical protein